MHQMIINLSLCLALIILGLIFTSLEGKIIELKIEIENIRRKLK